jgi:mannose-6-phosphate isomerase-like protein (cupin superfamily)
MKFTATCAGLCAILASAVLNAQQPQAQATYVDAEQLSGLLAKGGALASGPDFSASIARRTAAGQVEIHAKETDIFYIVDGTATFVTGGTMIGGKETRPNQMLGTDIQGGQTHQLKKGDFITIPAGVPHWFKDVPPTGITYYMVKTIKP